MIVDNMVVNPDTREFVDTMIQKGDKVRIAWCLDDNFCPHCDYSIGMDDWMYEYEGGYFIVDKMNKDFPHVACGAKVFEIDDYIWSTCWIDRFTPANPPQKRWEV